MDLGMNHKVSNYILNLPENQSEEFEWRMSNSGMCPRLMDYQIQHGKKKPDFKQALRMSRGRALHNMWQPMMMEIFGDDFMAVEQVLTLDIGGGEYVTGHCDGYIKSMDALWELKTVGEYTYKMVVNSDRPFPQHYEQANLYAHCYGASNVLMQYYDVGSGDSHWFQFPTSDSVAKLTRLKFKAAKERAELGVMIERPHTDPTSSPCWFCERKDECYEGWTEEVKGYGVDIPLDASTKIYTLSATALNARDRRLSSTKTEDAAKEEIAGLMLKNKANAYMHDKVNITVKTGAKGKPLIKIDRKK